MKIRELILLSILSLLLTACGFTLRGSESLSPALAAVKIQSVNNFSPLLRELRPRLQAAEVDLEPGDREAVRLVISRDSLRSEVLSVGAQARVREYELIYELTMSVIAADGQLLLEPQQLELRRDYSFDESQLLGKAREEEFLREELYRRMADLVMNRLTAIDT
jgi:LPS-assembly lipoprotein